MPYPDPVCRFRGYARLYVAGDTTRTPAPVDGRSDLWPGMVLYELLTGRLPFELGRTGRPTGAHYHIASRLALDAIQARTLPECCRPSS